MVFRAQCRVVSWRDWGDADGPQIGVFPSEKDCAGQGAIARWFSLRVGNTKSTHALSHDVYCWHACVQFHLGDAANEPAHLQDRREVAHCSIGCECGWFATWWLPVCWLQSAFRKEPCCGHISFWRNGSRSSSRPKCMDLGGARNSRGRCSNLVHNRSYFPAADQH